MSRDADQRKLTTPCACGHPRKDHTGMRMEVNGRCLECGCQEFDPTVARAATDDATLARIHAVIERAERLKRAVAERLAESRE
jgi:hypothetical protein